MSDKVVERLMVSDKVVERLMVNAQLLRVEGRIGMANDMEAGADALAASQQRVRELQGRVLHAEQRVRELQGRVLHAETFDSELDDSAYEEWEREAGVKRTWESLTPGQRETWAERGGRR